MASQSSNEMAIGFSQSTCLPLLRALMVVSAWYALATHTETASTLSSERSSSKVPYTLPPYSFTKASALSDTKSKKPAISQFLFRLYSCACRWRAMLPHPITATLIFPPQMTKFSIYLLEILSESKIFSFEPSKALSSISMTAYPSYPISVKAQVNSSHFTSPKDGSFGDI